MIKYKYKTSRKKGITLTMDERLIAYWQQQCRLANLTPAEMVKYWICRDYDVKQSLIQLTEFGEIDRTK